ncbi:MAG: protein kinase [Pyrinomonadaceae bacterium]
MAEAGNSSEHRIVKENNWEQVKNIFQAVIEHAPPEREQFLSDACRSDANLYNEIRELLDYYEEDDSFLDRAAIGQVAELFSVSREKIKPGENLGRYKIKSTLGAGGMGEVFLAEDTELERLVALKILSDAFSNDADRVHRFVQEAKSASALNHPNILTVYDFGQFDDLRFIVTEYVKGETLRQRQKRETLNLREILDAAAQVASALNAAHEAQIIHRDIKPENIMLREDSLVKVLDFGLAKLVEKKQAVIDAEDAIRAQIDTMPGMVMGTVAYMSPEQARGKPTDARTDIWSLGVCLYEMVADFQPFTGETPSDTIAAILKSQPVPLDEEVPAELSRIIRKSLQKKCEERYQSIKDLLIDLNDLRRELDFESRAWKPKSNNKSNFKQAEITDDKPVEQTIYLNQSDTAPNEINKVKTNFRGWLLTLAIIALLAAIVGISLDSFLHPLQNSDTFQTMRLTKLTDAGNVGDRQIAVSPDGKYTAYVVQEAKQQSLWVKHIATSANVRIIPPSDVVYSDLTFTRDSNYICYSVALKKGLLTLYQIPVLGGNTRKLMDGGGEYVTFSPDGNRIAFVGNQQSLMIANADGSAVQTLATASEGNYRNFLAWSPDGKTIVSALFSSEDTNDHLVETSVDDGTEKPLAVPGWLGVGGIAWLPDGSGLIVSGRDHDTKLLQLWHMTYPDGKLRRITNDLNSYQGVSLTADGNRIISIQEERLSNIWVGPNDGASLARVTFEKGKDEGVGGIAWTGDGKIVYNVKAGGTLDLWIVNQDGSDNRQLTFNARSNFSPSVSPDNRYIIFISDRLGGINVWKMDLDGSNPKQVTHAPGSATMPVWSPDGKWIVYQFTDLNNKTTIWKTGVDGGEPVQLTDVSSSRPVVSPDGEFFACLYGKATPESSIKVAIIPLSGGQPVKLLDLPSVVKSPNYRWTSDGQSIIYIDSRDRVYNLWSQTLDNNPPKQLTYFKSDRIFRFDFSKNGKGFALARGYESSDVVMISNFR